MKNPRSFGVLLIAVAWLTAVAACAAQPASPPLTIVTLGDSITKGVRSGVAADETFSAVIEKSLNEQGVACRVVNFGIGGERTDQALQRFDQVLKEKPRLVTVMYGTNDSYIDKGKTTTRLTVDEYRDNLRQIVARLRENDVAPVLMTEPRWGDDASPNGAGEHPNLRLEPFVVACRDVAKELRVPLIDQFADWTAAEAAGQDLDDWTTDSCHPNPVGHRRMAATMLPVLLKNVTWSAQQEPATPRTNEQLESGSEPVRIICFGDSVTGLYYHTGGRRAYTDMLEIALRRLYPKADVTTINAGISGNTTRNALERIDTDVLAKQPSLVTVMFGLNDMTRVPLDEYRANLITIVEKIRGVGSEVLLCTPNSVITTPDRPTDKLVQYCDIVREVAATQKVPLCDCYADYQTFRDEDPQAWRLLMSDEIHPNADGHKLIAESMARRITGGDVSLADVTPPKPTLLHSLAKLRAGEPIKVLAMTPLDALIGPAITQIIPDAKVEVVPWSVEGLTLSQIEEDAKARVRPLKPDLVVIAVPRSAAAGSREEFIRSYAWVMNWSLSFGRQEWDCLVVHPDVVDPSDSRRRTGRAGATTRRRTGSDAARSSCG